MADVGSLPSFLSDVADAIRETSATDENFTPSEFDEKIRNIPKESSGIEKIQKNGIDLEIVNKTVNIELDKSDVGLSNVENTSDMEKPISNLQKKEFEKKADKSEIPDVSDYITATVDNLENYYSKLEIDNKEFLTSIPNEYITEEELESKNYITENYVDEKIDKSTTYSINEQAIGVWIDGKTIYRKVINFGALPNATKKDVAHNISNLEQFTKVEGIATRQDDTKFTQPLPLVYKEIESNYNSSLGVDIQIVSIQTDEDRSMFNGYVILEYTKTTD